MATVHHGASRARQTRRRAAGRRGKQASAAPTRKVVPLPGAASPAGEAGHDGRLEPPALAFDRHLHAAYGQMTGGLSLLGLYGAYVDWAAHLAISPAKQWELAGKAAKKWARLGTYAAKCAMSPGGEVAPCIDPLAQDKRFSAPEWQTPPFNIAYQAFLLGQQWWHNATTSVRGVTREDEALVEFYSRQWLDMAAPSNFAATNPEVIDRTIREQGRNLLRGTSYLLGDALAATGATETDGAAQPLLGTTMAATPGKVVFRNRLIELIQYSPATETVHANPVLIVPAWIMKYYILDLEPGTSLVEYLVGRGHTVFCISWKNPDAEDRDLALDDYRQLGVMAALDAIAAINGPVPVNLVGYCLGGTMALVAAAAMAGDHDDRLASISLLAGQGDFADAGELGLFVTESQLALTEDIMETVGYLDQRAMAGAFRMLRSRDLVWSRMVREYLLGKRAPPNAFQLWNHDATRMPAHMHGAYLRSMYLNNDLAEGRFRVAGERIFLENIEVPAFVVATERDYIAPWPSVFKLTLILGGDVVFALASGGHNTGIVAAPDNPKASFRLMEHPENATHLDPDEWRAGTAPEKGSWWPAWEAWLSGQSGPMRAPPSMGNVAAGYPPLGEAPGDYVMET